MAQAFRASTDSGAVHQRSEAWKRQGLDQPVTSFFGTAGQPSNPGSGLCGLASVDRRTVWPVRLLHDHLSLSPAGQPLSPRTVHHRRLPFPAWSLRALTQLPHALSDRWTRATRRTRCFSLAPCFFICYFDTSSPPSSARVHGPPPEPPQRVKSCKIDAICQTVLRCTERPGGWRLFCKFRTSPSHSRAHRLAWASSLRPFPETRPEAYSIDTCRPCTPKVFLLPSHRGRSF